MESEEIKRERDVVDRINKLSISELKGLYFPLKILTNSKDLQKEAKIIERSNKKTHFFR